MLYFEVYFHFNTIYYDLYNRIIPLIKSLLFGNEIDYISRCHKCQLFYGAQDACERLTLRYVIALREAFIKASIFRDGELDTAYFRAIIILMRELPIGTKNRESREIGFLSH